MGFQITHNLCIRLPTPAGLQHKNHHSYALQAFVRDKPVVPLGNGQRPREGLPGHDLIMNMLATRSARNIHSFLKHNRNSSCSLLDLIITHRAPTVTATESNTWLRNLNEYLTMDPFLLGAWFINRWFFRIGCIDVMQKFIQFAIWDFSSPAQ